MPTFMACLQLSYVVTYQTIILLNSSRGGSDPQNPKFKIVITRVKDQTCESNVRKYPGYKSKVVKIHITTHN